MDAATIQNVRLPPGKKRKLNKLFVIGYGYSSAMRNLIFVILILVIILFYYFKSRSVVSPVPPESDIKIIYLTPVPSSAP